jgi:hypothetical protein
LNFSLHLVVGGVFELKASGGGSPGLSHFFCVVVVDEAAIIDRVPVDLVHVGMAHATPPRTVAFSCSASHFSTSDLR